jgi:prepilin-type N-terminal cleavage/methylation domain-containing protein
LRMIKRTAGFTLIEVLASLAILGTAVFMLLDAHYAALRMHRMMVDEVTLREFTESVASWAEAQVMAGTLTGSGDFGKRYPDYSWEFSGTEMGEDPSVLLYNITATVKSPEEERSVQFYVFNNGPLDEDTEKGLLSTNDTKRSKDAKKTNARSNQKGGTPQGSQSRGSSQRSRKGSMFDSSGDSSW